MFSLNHLALYIPVHHNLVYNQFMFSDLILTTWSQPHHLPQQLPWDHAQQEQTFLQLPALQEDQQQIEQILLWCVALSLGSIVRVEITKKTLIAKCCIPVFFETGSTGNAGTAVFTFGTATATRTFKVKATYYQCSSRNK